jgi:glycolate oxidase iron-sulfur subunit
MKNPDLESRPATGLSPEEQRAYDAAMHCNRCGFCTSFCPTYLATGDESLSPRGRNQAWRAFLEGRLDPADGQRAFDTCLLCGVCTSVCFAEVPTAKLMGSARQKTHDALGRSPLATLVLRVLLPRPRFFETFLKILFWGKRLGISGLLNRAGFLGWIHPRLAAAESLVETPPRRFLRGELPSAPSDAAVLQFLACGPNCVSPEIGRATARILKVQGVKAGGADNVCCGLPGISFGDREAARRLARINIALLEKHPSATVLVDDSSCAATVKDWPTLFEDDTAWKSRAEAVARRTRDLLEWLNAHPIPAPSTEGAVTYHDACKARYAQGLIEEPRRLLRGAPGVDYRELPEADQCCGGGGTYQFMQPTVSRAVGERKTAHILATGAAVVLTSSVSCLLQLRAGLRRAGGAVRALHVAEFFARALDKQSKLK